jgi:membrane fusion protein, multidrug efflux system
MTTGIYKRFSFLPFIFVFLLLLCSCKKENTAVLNNTEKPVKMAKIKKAPDYNYYTFPGKVEADRKVTLAFQVSGTLQELPATVGQIVKEGQILAKIDNRDYKNKYEKAFAKLLVAKSENERAEKLVKKHAVSEALYESKLTNYKVAKSDASIAKKAYEDTVLKAPFAGIIAQKFIDNFQDIKINEPVLILQSIRKLKIVVYVPGTFVLDVDDYNEYNADVSFPTLKNYTFPLVLKEFSTKADPETQSFKLTFSMTPPKDIYILPGMTAKVDISLKSRTSKDKENFIIPASAVAAAPDGKPYVWIINKKNNTAEQRFVKVGKLTADKIIITDGLTAGETIATSGVHYLRNGEKVRPFNLKEYN